MRALNAFLAATLVAGPALATGELGPLETRPPYSEGPYGEARGLSVEVETVRPAADSLEPLAAGSTEREVRARDHGDRPTLLSTRIDADDANRRGGSPLRRPLAARARH